MDFWALNAGYAISHAGNLGDATDTFDGIRYKTLGVNSNPSTDRGLLLAASTGLALRNISRRGDDGSLAAFLHQTVQAHAFE